MQKKELNSDGEPTSPTGYKHGEHEMFDGSHVDPGPLKKKWMKVWCCPRCCLPCNCLLHPCRKAVSRKKLRYELEGYDLDLVYVVPEVIVHGFPSTGVEHLYRNPRYELARFLDDKHPGQYQVYNFCCEPGRYYDPSIFDNRVLRFPFRDHNAPPLETLVHFGNSVKEWVDRRPGNVVSLHCKAGKGRAGLMACVALFRLGKFHNSDDAMDHYDLTRVSNRRGLTVYSQRKYVRFYERLWREAWHVDGSLENVPAEQTVGERFPIPAQPRLHITRVELVDPPEEHNGALALMLTVFQGTSGEPERLFRSEAVQGPPYAWDCDVEVQGNFCVRTDSVGKMFKKKKKKYVILWHNTAFSDPAEPQHEYRANDCDIKRRRRPLFSAEFAVRVFFDVNSAVPNPTGASVALFPGFVPGEGGLAETTRANGTLPHQIVVRENGNDKEVMLGGSDESKLVEMTDYPTTPLPVSPSPQTPISPSDASKSLTANPKGNDMRDFARLPTPPGMADETKNGETDPPTTSSNSSSSHRGHRHKPSKGNRRKHHGDGSGRGHHHRKGSNHPHRTEPGGDSAAHDGDEDGEDPNNVRL